MGQIFRFPKTYLANLVYVVLLPVFFIVFSMVYDPYDIMEFYDGVGGRSAAFHLVLLTCIQIGYLLLARTVFYFSTLKRAITGFQYYVICFLEVVAMSAFMALYTVLFFEGKMPFFQVLSNCFKFCSTILIYPYTVFILVRHLLNALDDLREGAGQVPEYLAKFYDEHHKLKLSIDPKAVLYVSAELNYITIHYLENSIPRDMMVRASMKSLERNGSCKFLIRCHRSYFVNPAHIKMLGRNKMGVIIAELEPDGLPAIPVSKQYYDQLSELL